MSTPALFSIHDVMPETLPQVASLIDEFQRRGRALPALLVVPGKAWTEAQVEQLRSWEQLGAELVAHGWHHHTTPRGLYHRLHALFLSRNVAEHLALDSAGVRALMQRSREWFGHHGLGLPDTYIPPAWALGIAPRELRELPFQRVETLRGVQLIDGDSVRFRPLPLLGFEADTAWRAAFLRRFNRQQLRQARRRSCPLRVSIHPQDGTLRLKNELFEALGGDFDDARYQQLSI